MGKAYGNPVAKCPKCEFPIGDKHPYAWCTECGEPLPEDVLRLVPGQLEKVGKAQPRQGSAPLVLAAGERVPATAAVGSGSATACIILGLLFGLVGTWFLLVSPSAPDPSSLTSSAIGPIVSLQRLAIGQTSAIMGAIFLAAGIRPR